MMDLVGIALDSAMLDGRSLVPLLANGIAEDRIAYSMGARSHYMAFSVRTPRYRYTEWVDLHTETGMFSNLNFSALPDLHITTLLEIGGAVETKYTELYDLTGSPTEKENIAADPQNVQLVEKLSELLHLRIEGPRAFL